MIQIKRKHLVLFLFANTLLIIVVAMGLNYAYSKFFWSDRVSIHSGINSSEYLGEEVSDTLVQAYVGQAYKIGTAFEVYKPKDPLLKIVSENHGALEIAVSSGMNHFSDLAKPRDAVIRKVGEGDLIFSIPSYTNKNERSIIFGNESKKFLEFNNFDEVLIETRNLTLNSNGLMSVNDILLKELDQDSSLVDYLRRMNQMIQETSERIDKLEEKMLTE